MKAVLMKNHGGPEVLESAVVPDPKPGPGEILLKVRACALNHLDFWVRKGIPAYKIQLPHILGCDVAGEVAALGPGVTGVAVGQRMAVAPGRSCLECDFCVDGRENECVKYGIIGAQSGPGGYAEYLAVPQRYLLPLSDSLSWEEAAAFPLTFLTSWHMLMTLGNCRPDQTVLVLGAGSGVGVAAIQIAKLAGARVIAASTSAEKLERARALGADDTIHSPPQDLLREVVKLTGRSLVDVVFEHIGPAVFDAALKCLRSGGRLITCGATTGNEVTIDMRYVFSRQLQILGSKMGTLREMRAVARLVGQGKLKPVVDSTFALEDARRAHEYLARQKQFGKVVLKIS